MIPLDQVEFVGAGLVRPECVLATRAGTLYTADWRGGVAALWPDGRQTLFCGSTADLPEGLRPNGIALEPDGSFLLAHLGSETGGVWRLDRQGQVSPLLTELDGVAIPPSNFVTRDAQGRLWLTVSTRAIPRALDYHAGASSGFIAVMDGAGARIVADGLAFTNECMPDAAGQFLYVNETYGRRLSRFPMMADGSLGPKQIVAEFGYGQFPDGLAFDENGDIWIAGIVSNQLLRVEVASGRIVVELEDADSGHVDWFEAACAARELGPAHMAAMRSTKLRNISSIAFGGPDRRQAYLGCLLGDAIGRVTLPVPGLAPVHWTYE